MPSLVCLIAPLIIMSPKVKGTFQRPGTDKMEVSHHTTDRTRNIVFYSGVAGLVFVPVFKSITHYPPFMGMMLSLGFLWLLTDLLHRKDNQEDKRYFSAYHALEKMDVPTLLFFLGILLAVAALESLGLLFVFATVLKETISLDLLMVLFGFASAVIDNVPLVAASLGMFTEFAPDDQIWHFLAYCAGTGGSMLIIGSAAGVVAMGMEKITFGWYLKKILWIALVGYFAGIAVFMLMRNLI